MSDQDNVDEMKVTESRRAERKARSAQRRADRQAVGLGWMAGLVLIAVGLFYLLYQYGFLPNLTNWWALFLLLPGVGTLSATVAAYRRSDGRWTTEVIVPLIATVFFFGLTAAFLFDFTIIWIWPLFLIAAGLLLLASSLFRQRTH